MYEYALVTDDVPIHKLSLMDQIRVMLKNFTYDKGAELKADDAVTTAEMTLKANLYDLLIKSTEPIRQGHKKMVKIKISSKFNSVFEEVIQSNRFVRYYDINVETPVTEYDIEYFFEVTMRVKDGGTTK